MMTVDEDNCKWWRDHEGRIGGGETGGQRAHNYKRTRRKDERLVREREF